MTFDPEMLARLEQFARELDAPEGESFDDVQQVHEDQAEAARETLRRQIADLGERAVKAQEEAAVKARAHHTKLYEDRRRILQDPNLSETQRRERLRTYDRSALPAHDLYDRELGTYHHLRDEQRRLMRELSALENGS